MSKDLPSISSSTSISDNADLRNYYEKLLFKNSSGKSLTDLPNKLASSLASTNNQPHSQLQYSTQQPQSSRNFDFINGFKNSLTISSPNQEQTYSSARNGTNLVNSSNTMYQVMSSPSSNPNSSSFHNTNGNPRLPQSAPIIQSHELNTINNGHGHFSNRLQQTTNTNGFNNQSYQDQLSIAARRSSYISDTLIDGHQYNNTGNNNHVTNTYNYNTNYSQNNNTGHPLQASTSSSSSYNTYYNNNNPENTSTFHDHYTRRHTQPAIPNISQFNKHQNSLPNNNNSNTMVNNGLILINGKQIISSSDLHALFIKCGSNYFSCEQVYKFIDNLKLIINDDHDDVAQRESIESSRTRSILNFMDFLRNCNQNFISPTQNGTSQTNNSNSNYQHYKPLVLVALKNGKLELLSTPQNTNLILRRGDLVIIDGDRGKDLVVVVEPATSLNFSIFINFLKKKIHFDSLITNKSQHSPNDKFIDSLIAQFNGNVVANESNNNNNNGTLNAKNYDLVELTQLIIPSKQVLRFATPWEVQTNLHFKFQDELKALHIAKIKLNALNDNNTNDENNGNQQSSHSRHLNIKILNAEFQFDRKKLTFYYVCNERNDFRDLIKELFKFYKTRIWLCAIPNNLQIDSKYYDSKQLELKLYNDMIVKFPTNEIIDINTHNLDVQNSINNSNTRLEAPPLDEIKLDDFQIAVYKELVDELFH